MTSFTAIASTNSISYTPSSVVTTTDYRRITFATFNGQTCQVISAVVRITVDAAPTVTLSGGTTPICAGDDVTFTAAGGAFYEFFVDGVSQGATSTSNTTSITGLTDGQQVTVEATNAQGCTALSSPTTISVSAIPLQE